MKLPRGELVRQRMVDDLGTVLSTALDDRLTGYARLESQDSLLLDADGTGVLTFEGGVPTVAYHTGPDTGGTDALADIAVTGPYRVELYRLDREVLAPAHATEDLTVPPTAPAERLVGDAELIERTRNVAPDARLDENDETTDAVAAFLEDGEAIETIRERARDEARNRAEQWGFPVEGMPSDR